MPSAADDPRDLAWYGTLHATLRCFDAIASDVAAETGHTAPVVDVLLTLAAHEGRMRMGQIAEALAVTPGGATRVVARMEQAGLVKREIPDSDRRATFAHLTAKGRRAADKVRPVRAAAVERHFHATLSDADLEALRTAAEKVLRGLGAPHEHLAA